MCTLRQQTDRQQYIKETIYAVCMYVMSCGHCASSLPLPPPPQRHGALWAAKKLMLRVEDFTLLLQPTAVDESLIEVFDLLHQNASRFNMFQPDPSHTNRSPLVVSINKPRNPRSRWGSGEHRGRFPTSKCHQCGRLPKASDCQVLINHQSLTFLISSSISSIQEMHFFACS